MKATRHFSSRIIRNCFLLHVPRSAQLSTRMHVQVVIASHQNYPILT